MEPSIQVVEAALDYFQEAENQVEHLKARLLRLKIKKLMRPHEWAKVDSARKKTATSVLKNWEDFMAWVESYA